MVEPESSPWPESLTATIGLRIARFRRERKLTAQQLSDALRERLGVEMKRTVIGGIEAGTRKTVSVSEIFAIAYVLAIPPILLMVPVGEPDEFEVLPGISTDPWTAATWLAGEGGSEWNALLEAEGHIHRGGDPPSGVNFLAMYRRHDKEVEHLLRLARQADAADTAAVRATLMERFGEREEGLRFLRWSLRELGSALPPLPPSLQHVDDSKGGEDARDQEDRAE